METTENARVHISDNESYAIVSEPSGVELRVAQDASSADVVEAFGLLEGRQLVTFYVPEVPILGTDEVVFTFAAV